MLTENIVDVVLEGSWRVGQAKRHDEELEGIIAAAKSSLPFVTRLDTKEMVSAAQVNLGKDLSAGKALEQEVDWRNGVLVLAGAHVELTVVDA